MIGNDRSAPAQADEQHALAVHASFSGDERVTRLTGTIAELVMHKTVVLKVSSVSCRLCPASFGRIPQSVISCVLLHCVGMCCASL